MLVDTVYYPKNFSNTIKNEYNYLNESIISKFLNSSPNYNLLYNVSYSKPLDNNNAFNIPSILFDFLFGSDLDVRMSYSVMMMIYLVYYYYYYNIGT
jgi:hypothetical protein